MRLKVLLCGLVLVTLLPTPLAGAGAAAAGALHRRDPGRAGSPPGQRPDDADLRHLPGARGRAAAVGRVPGRVARRRAGATPCCWAPPRRRGCPTDLFASGEARWLGIQAAGQAESPRILLVGVPYALEAGDADAVGGIAAVGVRARRRDQADSREDLQLSTRRVPAGDGRDGTSRTVTLTGRPHAVSGGRGGDATTTWALPRAPPRSPRTTSWAGCRSRGRPPLGPVSAT